jgi:DNA-binding response OmpR family regulator
MLERNGHDVFTAVTGADALVEYSRADLVLLDLDLSDIDGVEVCRRIRDTSEAPVIAFAAGGELDRVLGLQAGADDCLEKPYEFRELLARIDAVMRRLQPHGAMETGRPVAVGGLRLDAATRTAVRDGVPLDLTRREFDLLLYLMSHPETVLTRSRIMAEVWNDASPHPCGPHLSRTIDTHVSSLRTKLGDSRWIQTVRGVGFRLGYLAVPV